MQVVSNNNKNSLIWWKNVIYWILKSKVELKVKLLSCLHHRHEINDEFTLSSMSMVYTNPYHKSNYNLFYNIYNILFRYIKIKLKINFFTCIY